MKWPWLLTHHLGQARVCLGPVQPALLLPSPLGELGTWLLQGSRMFR